MTRARADAPCRARLAELSQYLDGELTPEHCRVLERHLDSCDCCRSMAEELRQTIAACRSAGGTRLPRDVRERAAARIQRLLQGTNRD